MICMAAGAAAATARAISQLVVSELHSGYGAAEAAADEAEAAAAVAEAASRQTHLLTSLCNPFELCVQTSVCVSGIAGKHATVYGAHYTSRRPLTP